MSWPCECLSFLKNPLVVRYQHRSAPVVLHTSSPVMLKLFTCAVGHCYHDHHHCVSTGATLDFHTGSSHVPSTLPQRLSCAEWNSPLKSLNKRHLAYSYSCSLGLGGGGWITNWSHLQVLAPRGVEIFFLCFVVLFFSGLDRLTLRVLLGSIGVALSPSMLSHDNGASQCLL